MLRRLALPTFAMLAGALLTAQAQTALPQQNSRPGQPTAEAQTKGSHERHATGTTAPNQDAQNQTRAQRRQGQGNAEQQGQQPQAGARSNSVAPAGTASTSGAADSELAACLQIDNQKEIDAAQFALQKSQNDEVKQFAQQMVQDHGKMIQDLAQFAGSRSAIQQTSATQPQGAGQNVQQAGGMRQPQAGVIDHVAFKQQLAEQCKQTMQKEWGEKSGAEFDKCYVGAQIGAHLHAIDTMRVAQSYASPELRQALDQGIQTASGHLQHAKEMMKKLEGQSSGSQSR